MAPAAALVMLAVAACGTSWTLYQDVRRLMDEERYAEAEPVARQALAHDEAAHGPESEDVAVALGNLAAILLHRGRPAESEAQMRRALAIEEKLLGPDDPAVAASLNNLASAFQYQGRFAEAEPLYRRALAIWEAKLGREHSNVASALNNLAMLLHAMRRHGEADQFLRRSLAIGEKARGPSHRHTIATVNNLASVLEGQGRHAEAEALYRQALQRREEAGGTEHGAVAHALNQLAGALLEQGRTADAEALYRRSLAVWEVAEGPRSAAVALALNNLGSAIGRADRHVEAEELYRQSLAVSEEVHGPENPFFAFALANLATQLGRQGRNIEAATLLQRSLAIQEKALGRDHRDVAVTLSKLAKVYRELGRHAEAEPVQLRSLAAYEATHGPDHPLVAQEVWGLAQLRELQGRAAEALGHYRRSSAIRAGRIDRAADAGASEQARLAEQRLSAKAFQGHMAIALRAAAQPAAGERTALQDEAFRLLDRAKATSTGAAVARMASRFAAGDNALARTIREQQDLADQLAAAEANLLRAAARPARLRDADAETRLRTRAAELQERLTAIDRRLRRDFASYAEIASPRPPAVAEVQALLGSDEALVAVAVGENASFVFALRRDRIAAARVDMPAGALAAAVRDLRAGLDPTGKSALESMPPFEAALAHELYAKLLGPVADLLDGASHLFAVTDGALDSLPLGVLLTAAPGKAQFAPGDLVAFREAPWLGTRVAISALPSVSALRALRVFARAAGARKPFLGIGDPLLKDHPRDPQAQRAPARAGAAAPGWTMVEEAPRLRALFRGGAADTEALRQVPSLPDTADELAAMARALGASDAALVLRERATEAAVKRAALADHKVLAFATHGIVAGEIAGLAEPALVLTPPAEPTTEDDGLLTASEVAELKLDADWVILSACNTAAPDGTPGAEGLSGLARAFFHAGARALLVSHWPVVSDAAVALTTRMLQEAARPGVGRAEAHRRAAEAMIADAAQPERAHPLFWAPFIVVGEGGAKR